MKKRRNIIVAVTGASGSIYARLLCQRLAQAEEVGDIALIVTEMPYASTKMTLPGWKILV